MGDQPPPNPMGSEEEPKGCCCCCCRVSGYQNAICERPQRALIRNEGRLRAITVAHQWLDMQANTGPMSRTNGKFSLAFLWPLNELLSERPLITLHLEWPDVLRE